MSKSEIHGQWYYAFIGGLEEIIQKFGFLRLTPENALQDFFNDEQKQTSRKTTKELIVKRDRLFYKMYEDQVCAYLYLSYAEDSSPSFSLNLGLSYLPAAKVLCSFRKMDFSPELYLVEEGLITNLFPEAERELQGFISQDSNESTNKALLLRYEAGLSSYVIPWLDMHAKRQYVLEAMQRFPERDPALAAVSYLFSERFADARRIVEKDFTRNNAYAAIPALAQKLKQSLHLVDSYFVQRVCEVCEKGRLELPATSPIVE